MTNAPSWHNLFSVSLSEADPEIATLIDRQRFQNGTTVNLVASENYAPLCAVQAEASCLVNKNASGYPPRISFAGGGVIDAIERLAIERARAVFGAEHANVQPLSSTIANVAVLRALLDRGDRILAFDRAAGGHGSHGSPRHVSGQDYEVESFGVDDESGVIDYETVRAHALAFRPRMIIAGSSSYPRAIDFARLRGIADEIGAMLFADIAHVSGLIIAGLHPNPVPFCDVVTTSTHKTFCGPRTGGLILSQRRYAAAIDSALAPGLQAAPGAHIIAARAALFNLVLGTPFRALMNAVVAHADVLARELQKLGLPLYAGGTDTHMVVVDLRRIAVTEIEVNEQLLRHAILANTCLLPMRANDNQGLGLRLGSTPMTIRGMGPLGFATVASQVERLIRTRPTDGLVVEVCEAARGLALAHPIPYQ